MEKKPFISVLLFSIVFFASPAWAAVNITCAQVADTNEVEISYTVTSEPNKVRAFALDITVDKGVILSADSFNNDYNVYPGSIVIVGGAVSDEGSPICDSSVYPGTLGGLGTSGITVEMASAYRQGMESPPADSGKLLSIYVTPDCNVTIAENTIRGGVVLEDPAVDPTVYAGSCQSCTGCDCTCYTGPDCLQWLFVGSPDCWCASVNPRQCHGDATGGCQGRACYYVSTYDLDVLLTAWNKPYSDLIDAQGDHLTINVGGRDVALVCADFDHNLQGRARYLVSTYDLDILLDYWNTSGKPDPNCP